MSICFMNSFYKDKKNIVALIEFFISVIILIYADQYTKHLAISGLKGKTSISLIKNVIEFTYIENRGAAFGMFKNSSIFFVAIGIIFCLVSIFYYAYLPMIKRFQILRVLILFAVSGTIGNIIDRIEHRYVIDFIYFKAIDFPVFNVADIYLTCSILVFAILLIFYYKDEDLNAFVIRKKKSAK